MAAATERERAANSAAALGDVSNANVHCFSPLKLGTGFHYGRPYCPRPWSSRATGGRAVSPLPSSVKQAVSPPLAGLVKVLLQIYSLFSRKRRGYNLFEFIFWGM